MKIKRKINFFENNPEYVNNNKLKKQIFFMVQRHTKPCEMKLKVKVRSWNVNNHPCENIISHCRLIRLGLEIFLKCDRQSFNEKRFSSVNIDFSHERLVTIQGLNLSKR